MMNIYKIVEKQGKKNIEYYEDDVLVLVEFMPENYVIREGYYSSVDAYKLECDVDFGNKLIAEFLIDNRLSPIAFNPLLSISVLQKFQAVKALAEVGDIKNVKLMLGLIEVDELFTQERKDKYILMCEKHLSLWV